MEQQKFTVVVYVKIIESENYSHMNWFLSL